MNGKGEWTLGQLLELYLAEDARDGELGHVFRVGDGQSYATQASDKIILKRRAPIFPL